MKSIDIFCASPASTAICSSTDQRRMIRHGGFRPLHDHMLRRLGDDRDRDHRRSKSKTKTKTKTPVIPCSSEIPISPRHYFEKYRKSTSSSCSSTTTTTPKISLEFLRKKSSADITDLYGPSYWDYSSSSSKYLLSDTPSLDLYFDDDHPPPSPPRPPQFHHQQQHYNSSSKMVVNPPRQPLVNIEASKRHNNDVKESPVFRSSNSLSNTSYDNSPVFEVFSSSSSSLSRRSDDLHAHQKMSSSWSRLHHHHHHVHGQKSRAHEDFHVQKSSLSRVSTSSPATKSSSSLTSCKDESYLSDKSSRPRDHQVVELRVSIHCKGCEGKIRKHISRMEGVTSFSIDLATKKVTVIGNVTPLGVLTSISKVKFAEFWPSPTSSSSSSSTPSSSSTSTSSTSTANTSSGMSIVSY